MGSRDLAVQSSGSGDVAGFDSISARYGILVRIGRILLSPVRRDILRSQEGQEKPERGRKATLGARAGCLSSNGWGLFPFRLG